MVVLVWLLRRQIGLIDGRRIATSAGGAVLAALRRSPPSPAALWFALHWFAALGFVPLLLSVVVAVFAGGLVYLRISQGPQARGAGLGAPAVEPQAPARRARGRGGRGAGRRLSARQRPAAPAATASAVSLYHWRS